MKAIVPRLLIVILVFTTINCSAQDSIYVVEVDSVEITNSCFKEILDSIINNEMKCAYYTSGLSFGIDIYSISDDTIMCTFESLNDPSLYLEINPVGFFKYCNHLFIIQETLLNGVFRKSGTKQKFDVTKDKSGIIYAEDDSYTMLGFLFVNGRFIYFGGSPPCLR